jgi:hypothetical protein
MTETDLAVIGAALQSAQDDPLVYVAVSNGTVIGFIHLHSWRTTIGGGATAMLQTWS